jgi:hypothetical protein
MENLEQIVNNNSNNGTNIERHPIDKKKAQHINLAGVNFLSRLSKF